MGNGLERREIASSQPSTRPEPSFESSDGPADVTGTRRGEAAGFGSHVCRVRGHSEVVLLTSTRGGRSRSVCLDLVD